MTTEPNTAEEFSDLDEVITPQIIFEGSVAREFYTKEQLKKHTAQTLDRLREKVKKREDKLDEKISKLKLSANPNDWILANGIENVKMGVHSVLQLIEEVSDG